VRVIRVESCKGCPDYRICTLVRGVERGHIEMAEDDVAVGCPLERAENVTMYHIEMEEVIERQEEKIERQGEKIRTLEGVLDFIPVLKEITPELPELIRAAVDCADAAGLSNRFTDGLRKLDTLLRRPSVFMPESILDDSEAR